MVQIVHLRRSKYQQRRCHKERREVLCATNAVSPVDQKINFKQLEILDFAQNELELSTFSVSESRMITGLAGRVLLQLFQIVILMYSLAEWKGTDPFADIDLALSYISEALEMVSGPLGAPLGLISTGFATCSAIWTYQGSSSSTRTEGARALPTRLR